MSKKAVLKGLKKFFLGCYTSSEKGGVNEVVEQVADVAVAIGIEAGTAALNNPALNILAPVAIASVDKTLDNLHNEATDFVNKETAKMDAEDLASSITVPPVTTTVTSTTVTPDHVPEVTPVVMGAVTEHA